MARPDTAKAGRHTLYSAVNSQMRQICASRERLLAHHNVRTRGLPRNAYATHPAGCRAAFVGAQSMEELDAFFSRHRTRLLRYLDGEAPSATSDPGPLEYVDEVLNEWQNLFSNQTLTNPLPEERTFWYALYQLEDLVEFPVTRGLDPYEGIMMRQLAVVRERLRDRSALPDGFFATRPGEGLTAL